ncbi:tol-pal system-associated acyl-CoA thioesterase [Pseudoteredinibacter isoporae]|uniref:4-hydroxybenzoyl-CoA thioesterase/acyl-CoA thioester hydrolase n=1 Tax=Pseudoteredinibacter isoporae TaxID=570281 RepID=A0A7X0JWV6_9GAMM|nr:tol-pal system-associated acyl-CoA thioesterase [Pseudoteredinibacter isoporae]MBB6522896.1 4-hydroxybenzoyl-CoA thioesterase/acyl-CoA thioester hydrolase [Pseudoteredinibacter isoporae]
MKEAQKGEFSLSVRVYIEDTDAGGIVYYVNYLKFMERARTEMMRSLGFDKAAVGGDGQLMVVHSAAVNYRKPARLDDELRVSAKVIQCRRSYLVFRQEVRRAGSEELLCEGEIKVACVDGQTMKPKAMPKAITEALNTEE